MTFIKIVIIREFNLFVDIVLLSGGRVFRFRTRIKTIKSYMLQVLCKMRFGNEGEKAYYRASCGRSSIDC